jgi:hypothetical protein
LDVRANYIQALHCERSSISTIDKIIPRRVIPLN